MWGNTFSKISPGKFSVAYCKGMENTEVDGIVSKVSVPEVQNATVKAKPKRVMDETKLKQLAEARKKAFEVRKQNKDINEKAKALKEIEKVAKQRMIAEQYERMVNQFMPKPQVVEEKPKKKIVYKSDSDDEEVVYVKKPKHKKKVVYQSDSDGEVEEKKPELDEQATSAQIKSEMARLKREMATKMMFSSGF